MEAARRQIQAILSGQHVTRVLKVDYDPDQDGADRLHYEIDTSAIDELANELCGRHFLITDRNEWSDEQILLTYRGQSEVEEAFRQLKDDGHMSVRRSITGPTARSACSPTAVCWPCGWVVWLSCRRKNCITPKASRGS